MPLIASCSQCGKNRFFFSLVNGLCRKCVAANNAAEQLRAEAERTAGLSMAKKIYDELATLWKATGDRWYTCAYKSVYDAKQAISNCNQFSELLHKLPEYKYFQEVFAAHCTSMSTEICINEDFGRLEVSQVDTNTIKIDFEQLLRDVDRCKERASLFVHCSEEFECTLSRLKFVEILVDEHAIPYEKGSPSMLESKNITARTALSKLNPFFAIDIETTGLNPMTDEIISLSAVKFVNFEPVEVFSTYVKPRHGLKPRAQAINGIADKDIVSAPYIESVAAAFNKFITPDWGAKNLPPIVGHNLSFDYQFLRANGINTLCFTRNHYDTLELSKRQYKYEESYKLDRLALSVLHISRSDSHSSISDALVAGLLFKKICEERIGA